MKQEDIGRALAQGSDPTAIRDASNVRAVRATESDQYDALITSYGWAVIFGRERDGTMVEFTGWQGYSASTSTQMGKIRRAIREVTGEDPRKEGVQPVHSSANRLNHRVQRVDGEVLG